MSQLDFSPAALEDIEGIWDYTAHTWGLDQAERYTENIWDACLALSTGRQRGRAAFDIREGYFKYPIGRHFIFFVEKTDGISVIRILHQRMDLERHL